MKNIFNSPGFEGAFCEVEVDDCAHKQANCLNGGFCMDLVNDFRCVCATGFTGASCEKIDESVCDVNPNHVWRYNDTLCEQVCVCTKNSAVQCTCQEDQIDFDGECHSAVSRFSNQPEIRVTFDGTVSNTTCVVVNAIQSLLTGNQDFCCKFHSPTELSIRVSGKPSLAQYISRTVFPHMLHVVVNKRLERMDWFSINLLLIAFFTFVCLALLYLYLKAHFKRKQQMSEAQNVVIHCIQNNLKPNQIKSLTPSPVSSNMINQKLCNTLTRHPKSHSPIHSDHSSLDDLEKIKCFDTLPPPHPYETKKYYDKF